MKKFIDNLSEYLKTKIEFESKSEYLMTLAIADQLVNDYAILDSDVYDVKQVGRIANSLRFVFQNIAEESVCYSKDKFIQYLFNNFYGYLDLLFNIDKSYQKDNYCKIWELTKLGEDFMIEASYVVLELINQDDIIKGLILTRSKNPKEKRLRVINTLIRKLAKQKGLYQKDEFIRTTYESKCVGEGVSGSSLFKIVTTNGVSIQDGRVIVPLKSTSNVSPLTGRFYTIFSQMPSIDRKRLGYIEYDINAAQQSLCLQIDPDTDQSDFPLIKRYSQDTAFRNTIRESLTKELNITMKVSKLIITSVCNGMTIKGVRKLIKQHTDKTLKLKMLDFIKGISKESVELREIIFAYISKNEELLMDVSKRLAQRKHIKGLTEAINRAIFFHIWTFYEKLSRQAMKSCFKDAISVHDGIYSIEALDQRTIELKIKKLINLNLTISVSYL